MEAETRSETDLPVSPQYGSVARVLDIYAASIDSDWADDDLGLESRSRSKLVLRESYKFGDSCHFAPHSAQKIIRSEAATVFRIIPRRDNLSETC